MKTLFRLALIAGSLCAALTCKAGMSTVYYINANNYSGVKGGSITGTVTRMEVNGSCSDWNPAASATVTIYLSQSGTYPISAGNVSGGWQNGYQTITIPANYYSANFSIPLVQDNNEDYDRTGTLTVDNPCGNPTQGYTSATITVQDNNTPMAVGFWVGYWTNNLSVLEGGVSGVNQATIYFFRDQTNTQTRTINYTLSGNAVANTDYTPPIGTITIPMGSWYTAVTISATNAAQSTTKTLGVAIASGTYKINSQNPSCTTTILPDYPTLSVQASLTNVLDGGVSGAANSTFTISRDITYTYGSPKTVHLSVGGTASGGSDYSPSLSTTVTLAAGASSTNISITALANNQQTTKTAIWSLTSGNYNISSSAGGATIYLLPDYPTLSVQASPASILDGAADGAGSSTFTISRDITYVYGGPKTVNFSVGGTASGGSDYSPPLSSPITLPSGVSSTNISITALANNQQVNKTATVTLTSSGGYNINSTNGNATVTLLADYPTVDIFATNYTATDGESTTAFVIYQETYFTNGPAKTVYYSISGTASNGVDFSPFLTGSVVIPAGQDSNTIPITPLFHTSIVGTRELTLSLLASGAYAVGTNNSATIGLLQDAPIINVSASQPYATVAGQTGQFQITRSGGLSNSLAVNFTVSGTAVAGSDYTALPASVTFAVNQTATNLNVTPLANPPTQGKTVVLSLSTNSNYYLGAYTNAIVTLLTTNTASNSTVMGRYWRGTGSDPTYWSMVVPLDYQQGVVFSNLSGNCSTLYPGLGAWSAQTLYHYDATNALPQTSYTNRIAFNNPIVAFGSLVGGTPLYLNQDYHFGIYAGNEVEAGTPIYINAYYRSNYAYAGAISLTPPNMGSASSWTNYISNNFHVAAQGYVLTVTLSDAPYLGWGIAPGGGAYELTENASAQATNYYYLVEAYGYPGSQGTPLVLANNTTIGASLLYTMDFEARPQWRSIFVDQPQFDGSPLPPFYEGMTLEEMLTNTPPVTNAVSLAPSACTNLDDSPELRRHPILDQFVSDMGNDPIALANYVFNKIDLTDWMDYGDDGNVSEQSINLGGVSRGAVGTFLEKQGSPAEQCALLVYLLRQAGVPATYVYPPHNGLQMLDARLSRMFKFQVQGGFSESGQPYDTNTMIAVNYPWVAAYIGTNWVHLFPWIKDYSIVEGLDLYDYMPTNYSTAYGWVKDYIYGSSNLLSLAVDGDATPRVILPAYLKQTLLQNYPGISVDDLGVQIYNRQHYYARWQDFPTPTWVTNVCTAVESLGSSGITNVNPALTNIFDTVSVEVYSVNSPNRDIQTGDMRLVDLHNRKFYITESNNAPNQIRLSLVLAPFNTNITTVSSFGSSDPTLKSKQVLPLGLDQFDDQLNIRFKYNRHRGMGPSYPIDPTQTFYNFDAARTIILERPLRKGDVAAICMNYGRVTRDMLNVWATDLWQMENALAQNPSLTNTISPDIYQGTTMYLAGMKYYEKCSEFDAFNANLHKIDNISLWAAGLSKISPARDASGDLNNGGVDPILPNVDMFFYEIASVGNGTLRPDSGRSQQMEVQNYNVIEVADFSAEEHQVINSFYQQTNAVSTVRLLQLAQSSGAGIVPLTIENYAAQGATVYQGKPLQSWDSNLWSQVTSTIQNPSTYGYATAYITPGPITNTAYKGMGALVLGWGLWQALITPESMNGAFGDYFPYGTISAANTLNYDLWDDPDEDEFGMDMAAPEPGESVAPPQIPTLNASVIDSQIGSGDYVLDPVQLAASSSASTLLNTAPQANQNLAVEQSTQTVQQNGNQGSPSFWSQLYTSVSDPVNNITGESYVDETDLRLPGPIPLALRRNYSSQNLADNQFGPGWKLSIMPYLCVSVGSTNIYAADMDGSVLAYVQTATNANVWLPTLAANPQLNNNTTAGVGSLANRLRDRLVQSAGSTTNYTLYGADGSIRTFQVMSFNNGAINQTRPYLLQWTDNRGNYYTFTYGTNASQTDFGQARRIQCSNGNYLGFYFDIYGHIIEAYCGDGRRLEYEYDQFGDLITVTLPDETTRSYVYQHGTQAVTNGTVVTQQPYSTHLIIEEDKPDGRELINVYDSQRRVTNQLSTAGADLTPVRTATFIYANNFNITNSYTNTVTGYTLVLDGNNNTNRYDYTNSLITQITDPLGQTVQQTWYPDNATAPGYPRSVSLRKDKRGLLTQFQYDSNGDVTNAVLTGDLTGDGISNQTATNTAVYNANCLPLQTTDPAGNSTVFVYDPTFTFLPQQVIRYAGATPVSTTFIVYGSVTNVVAEGSITQTNVALGLAVRQIRAYGSSDAATNDTAYNGQGFPIQTVRYTGTGDPAITNTFFYNERGQMVDQVDSLGALTHREYDAMDRPTEQSSVDEHGITLSSNFNYYNENGELAWQDGPAYNPDDYVWFDYDGAGRLRTEIHWRAEANPNGTGVQAPAGYNLFAQTFYTHDVLGNLTYSVNPRGVITTNTWDSLNRLVKRSVIETNGSILTTEGFGYEPGGLERFHTNALGGFIDTEYTTTGKPEYRSNADGSTNGWRYYLDGRVRREIQRNGAYWQTTYNDASLTTTRIFYSAAGVPLATNSTTLDRRGNAVQRVDAAFNVFTSSFDGLDRLKVSAGPATTTVTENCGGVPGCGVYVTNILQQVTTRTYDAANRVLTVSDALGEKTVTTSDMLGRVLSVQTFAAGANTPLRVTSYAYSADHHSVTVTEGSGPEAVVTTTFTDNDGRKLLTIKYPSAGASEFTLNQYDLAGNLIHEEHDSSGTPTVWTKADCTFDGLNRIVSKSDRDGALTTFAYDAANDPTSRLMPGGLLWSATYNNAGQELQDWVSANGYGTQSNSYSYYPSGAAAVGLEQTKTDGAGVISTFLYDDWLRLTNATRQQPDIAPLVTSWGYDARGLATNITEENHTWTYDPGPIVVARSFDAYAQMTSESVMVGGATFSSATQGWDVAGRRTLLSLSSQVAGMSYGNSWRADGLLGAVSTPVGGASYGYSDGGLLDSRAVGNRVMTVNSRDGTGRPLTTSTTVNAQQNLAETLTWTGDGLLATHTLARTDFTDQRSYSYASLSRRLTTEQMNLDATHYWTNDFVYDSGIGAGLGLLTYAGAPSSTAAAWNGNISPLCRINRETNTVWRETAYGRLNGAATVSAFLDGHPLPVSISTTMDYSWTNRWCATMELTPGTHQLTVSALHPSGFFTTNATAWFTNNVGQQTDQIYRDGAGQITQRSYTSANGTGNHTQVLGWDFKGRLCNVVDCDAQGKGFCWIVEYDGLDRVVWTEWSAVTNGVVDWGNVSGQTNSFVYDPQIQFLDLGVYVGPSSEDSMPGQMTWKLCGPDLNGRYGGMNGAGGVEATATGLGYFSPTLNDARGNILGVCDPEHGTVAWSPSRPTGYGAVPGYRPLPLGHGGSYAQSAAWRGKWADVTGYIYIGKRFYDPVAGMWLSPDPVWNSQDPSYWSYCGGDPVNHFDPTGRCIEGAISKAENWLWSNPSAYQVGLEWVTGLGPRNQTFGPGDKMFQQLMQTEYPGNGQALLLNQLNGSSPGDSYLPVQFGRNLGAEPAGAFYAGFVSDLYNNPTRAYLGSFDGTGTVSSSDYDQETAVLNFTAKNQSGLESATRLPPPYGYSALSDGSARPTLTQIVSTWLPETVSAAASFPGNLASDVWNLGSLDAGWQEAVSQFQISAPPIHTVGDLVPKSILPNNFFGAHGPFSTVSQTFQWQQTVQFQPGPSPSPTP